MKIIAQSLAPSSPLPYLHLGYVSAYSDQSNAMTTPGVSAATLLNACIILFVLGVGVLLTVFRRQHMRTRIIAVSVGLACIIGSLLCGRLSIRFHHASQFIRIRSASQYRDPVRATHDHLHMLDPYLATRLMLGLPVPERLSRLYPGGDALATFISQYHDDFPYRIKSPPYYPRSYHHRDIYAADDTPPDRRKYTRAYLFEDGWQRPLKLHIRTVNGGEEYQLVSAGKDHRFGTRDDITGTRFTPTLITAMRAYYRKHAQQPPKRGEAD